MSPPDETVELTSRRREVLDTFVRDNWDLLRPQDADDSDIEALDQIVYSGALLIVRSRDFSDPDDHGEVILKVHTGLGYSEQIGLLHTVVGMMDDD